MQLLTGKDDLRPGMNTQCFVFSTIFGSFFNKILLPRFVLGFLKNII